jgi:hypothetical protein
MEYDGVVSDDNIKFEELRTYSDSERSKLASEIKKLELDPENALILFDGEADWSSYKVLEEVIVCNLTIYDGNIDCFTALPALKRLVFKGCEIADPGIEEQLKRYFKKIENSEGINGIWERI